MLFAKIASASDNELPSAEVQKGNKLSFGIQVGIRFWVNRQLQ